MGFSSQNARLVIMQELLNAILILVEKKMGDRSHMITSWMHKAHLRKFNTCSWFKTNYWKLKIK